MDRAAGYPNQVGTMVRTEVYSGDMAEVFTEEAIAPNITTSKWEKDAKKTEGVVIRFPPVIHLNKHVKGGGLSHEIPEITTTKILMDQCYDYAARLDKVDFEQTDLNVIPSWVKQVGLYTKETVDEIVLQGMVDGAGEVNCGATAGPGVNCGTASSPRQFTITDSLEIVTDTRTVLRTQKIPKSFETFIALPPWAVQRTTLSSLSKANEMGDAKSVLRGGALGKIGQVMVYESNLIPEATVSNTRIWYCPFGIKNATAFAWQFADDRQWDNVPMFHGPAIDGIFNFGFKVVSPEYLGCLIIKR